MRLNLDTSGIYDSNVYATSVNEEDDFSFRLKPSADLTLDRSDLKLTGNLYVDALQHLQIGRESNTQFGAALGVEFQVAPDHRIITNAHFDRLTENRTDPDARAPIFAKPRKINDFGGQLGYRYAGANFRVALDGTIRQIDYLDAAERDRDHRSYEGTARLSWVPRGATALFIEGYVVRRDFRLNVDFSGVDRDGGTVGVNIGVNRELSGRLNGSVGAGVFHFEPDDPSLQGYSGLGLSGWLTWTPRTRTSIALNLFRGDVATIRSGATGRTDTRISLHIDQEVLHNFLLGATASWTRNQYRGAPDAGRKTYGGTIEAEYLLSPRLSLFTSATFTQRDAKETPTQEITHITDDFTKTQFQLGIRVRF